MENSKLPYIPHLKWCRVPQLSSEKCSIHYASLSAMFNPLRSISNQELFEKHPYNPRIPKEMVPHAQLYRYDLKSEVSITLRCQLYSTCYTAVRIKNCLKSTSAIKIALQIRIISVMKGSHHVLSPN